MSGFKVMWLVFESYKCDVISFTHILQKIPIRFNVLYLRRLNPKTLIVYVCFIC